MGMKRHKRIDLYIHAVSEYRRLLREPFDSWSRTYNQAYMAFLRDFIALYEDSDSEEVQDRYQNANLPANPPNSPEGVE